MLKASPVNALKGGRAVCYHPVWSPKWKSRFKTQLRHAKPLNLNGRKG